MSGEHARHFVAQPPTSLDAHSLHVALQLLLDAVALGLRHGLEGEAQQLHVVVEKEALGGELELWEKRPEVGALRFEAVGSGVLIRTLRRTLHQSRIPTGVLGASLSAP